jgi:hypothetical protein
MAHQARRTSFMLAVAVMVVVALVGTAVPSDADTILFLGLLAGFLETPPISTTASGSAVVELDTTTNKINWIITHSVVSPTAAHFHGNSFPLIDPPAPILVDIPSNSVNGLTSPMIGSATLTAQQVTDLLAGRWYVNVHSSNCATCAAGEIRAQLAATSGAPLLMFPGPGANVVRTAQVDLTLILRAAGGASPVGGSVILNVLNITAPFFNCLHTGTLAGGGQTFRCPIAGGTFSPGAKFLSAVVSLSDGSSVGTSANWVVVDNTEP